MIKNKGLLDLGESSSLIRNLFDRELSLNNFNAPTLFVPSDFKDLSFIPGKKGLDLFSCMNKLKKYLDRYSFPQNKYDQVIPGVIEAIKNAYEHGNLMKNDKTVFWHQKLMKNHSLEILIGDEGEKIDGNLFSYALKIKQEKLKGVEEIADYYSFCGKTYAPMGHSGVGTKVMNKCFDRVKYFKNKEGGLTVYLGKKLNH